MTSASDARRRALQLGVARALDGRGAPSPLTIPPHHLTTHGVVVGMTGSGKTGLLMVLVEEALRARIPVLMIDVKGDLPNLLLAFRDFEAASVAAACRPTPTASACSTGSRATAARARRPPSSAPCSRSSGRGGS